MNEQLEKLAVPKRDTVSQDMVKGELEVFMRNKVSSWKNNQEKTENRHGKNIETTEKGA